MAGYATDLKKTANEDPNKKENRWFKLEEGTFVFRLLPPCSSYFDPNAPPLSFFRYERKILFDFPLREGTKNVVVDKEHIINRALRAYQRSLGDWETQKAQMKINGMSRWWPKQRGAYNVLVAGKTDKPYWLDLAKLADQELYEKIVADPSIIDLEKGRAVKLTVKGKGQYDRKYTTEIASKSSKIMLSFDPKMLDDLAAACAPTPIDWREIAEPTLREWAIKLMNEEAEVAAIEQKVVAKTAPKAAVAANEDVFDAKAPVPGAKAKVVPPKAVETPVDDSFGGDFGAGAGKTEEVDVAAFQAALNNTEEDDGFGQGFDGTAPAPK